MTVCGKCGRERSPRAEGWMHTDDPNITLCPSCLVPTPEGLWLIGQAKDEA